MFVLSFQNGNNDPTINYMPLVEIKDFNALTDNKPFVDLPLRNKQEVYEKLIEKFIRLFVKTFINLLIYIYQEKQIQVFLNKLN